MRDKAYVTMLDPLQAKFGTVPVLLLYLASLAGDVLWTASILSALGTSLSIIVQIDLVPSIVASASVTVLYTMVGQMLAVAYTDVVQLVLIVFGLGLSVPFVLTSSKVGDMSVTSDLWLGHLEAKHAGVWADLLVAMTVGTIPWQAYFQRVLSVRSSREAQILSMVGACGALVCVIPSLLMGAVATAADWSNTTLGVSPAHLNQSSLVLPYVLQQFTPYPVAILGLCAVAAAVMSSMDSSVLGSSSMLTHNIYHGILRVKASSMELMIVQRVAILCVGVLATVISVSIPVVFGLFVLAADIVAVIVFPQLVCAIFIPGCNGYGSIAGFLVGLVLRLGAGEPLIGLQPLIEFPFFDGADMWGQLFPYRTFAMLASTLAVVGVSHLAGCLHKRCLWLGSLDVLRAFKPHSRDGVGMSEENQELGRSLMRESKI